MVSQLQDAKTKFSTLMNEVQPVVTHFIVWLDEKVAEYKVQGYMNLDSDVGSPKWLKDYSISLLTPADAERAPTSRHRAQPSTPISSPHSQHNKKQAKHFAMRTKKVRVAKDIDAIKAPSMKLQPWSDDVSEVKEENKEFDDEDNCSDSFSQDVDSSCFTLEPSFIQDAVSANSAAESTGLDMFSETIAEEESEDVKPQNSENVQSLSNANNPLFEKKRYRKKTEKPYPRRPQVCPTCGIVIKRQDNFKRHMLKHSSTSRHLCNVCSKFYRDLTSLNQHIQTVHKNERHMCDQCARSYCTKTALILHQKGEHSKTFKFHCEQCNKGYNSPMALDGHMNGAHYKTKPHTCDICGHSFAWQNNLFRHKVICNMERSTRPSCLECGKQFKHADSLKRHEKMHKAPNKYSCGMCGKVYSFRNSWKAHIDKCTMRTERMSGTFMSAFDSDSKEVAEEMPSEIAEEVPADFDEEKCEEISV